MGNFFPKAKTHGVVIQPAGEETLVYDLTTNEAFLLNETSAQIWNACDGNANIDEIVTAIGTLPREVALMGLADLCDKGLVSRDTFGDHFSATISRRQAIAKYGAMLAIPLIASLVAPRALHAASACIPDNGIFTLKSTDTNDCFQPVNFNKCCSKSIKTTASDGISTVTCTCGVVVIN